LASRQVDGIAEVTAGSFGRLENRLVDIGHLGIAVLDVECDQVGQGFHPGVAQAREVGGNVPLELVKEDHELVVELGEGVAGVHRINDGGSK